jgi:hypothetical protein
VRERSPTTISSGSSFSSPLLDDESGDHNSVSPLSQAMASYKLKHASAPDEPSASISPQPNRSPGSNNMVAAPLPLPNGLFLCPQCPRKFSGFGKARYD